MDSHPSSPHQRLMQHREHGPVPIGTGRSSSVPRLCKSAERQYSILVKQPGSGPDRWRLKLSSQLLPCDLGQAI